MRRSLLLALLLANFSSLALADQLTVTTATDLVDPSDGQLSLREAIANSSTGDSIVFDLSLDGATILTTGGTLLIDKELTIDGSVLPAGIRLDAMLAHRLFDIVAGASLTIEGATLLRGRTTNQNGGFVRCLGNLTMRRCLVTECVAGFGGGIFASGSNTEVLLEHCTFSANSCRNAGTAIAGTAGAKFQLAHCTLYSNTGLTSLPAIGAGAGGYFTGNNTEIRFHHCIFGENRDSAGNLINGWAVSGAQFISEGYNLTDDPSSGGAVPTDLIGFDPMLSPLTYWGGLTACHLPLTASPVIDAGDPSLDLSQSRDGLNAPRIHNQLIDLGAIERGTSTFEQWAEFHGVSPDPFADDDADGSSHLAEYIHGTNPDVATDYFTPEFGINIDGRFFLRSQINTDLADVILNFENSPDLQSWSITSGIRSSITPPAGIFSQEVAEAHSIVLGQTRTFARNTLYLGRPQ